MFAYFTAFEFEQQRERFKKQNLIKEKQNFGIYYFPPNIVSKWFKWLDWLNKENY